MLLTPTSRTKRMPGLFDGLDLPATIAETAARCKTSPRSLRGVIKRRNIEVLKVGTRLMFDTHALNQLESALRCHTRSSKETENSTTTSASSLPATSNRPAGNRSPLQTIASLRKRKGL